MTVVCVGTGAGLRRPESFERMHLRFDNESQVFYDLTGQTIVAEDGATQTATNSKFIGGCCAFDGTSDGLVLGAKANTDFLHQLGAGSGDGANTKWSISFLIRFSGFSATQIIFDNCGGVETRAGIRIQCSTSRVFALNIYKKETGKLLYCYFVYPNNTNWHYMVIDYDQTPATGNCKMYLDGAIQSMTGADKLSSSPSSSTAYDDMHLGISVNADGGFTGNIDELTIRTGINLGNGSTVPVPTRRY